MHRTGHPPLHVQKRSGGDKEVSPKAIFTQFQKVLTAIYQRPGMGTELQWQIRPVNRFVARHAHAFPGFTAKPIGHGLVHAQYPVLVVDDGNQIWNTVEGKLPFLFGLPQLFLGPLAVGDVLDRTEKMDRPAQIVEGDLGMFENDTLAAVWSDYAVF
jgi:hypothetical protein